MSKIKYGKYAGWEIHELPSEYINFMIAQYEKNLRDFNAELCRRQAQEDASLSMAERIIGCGYRTLSKEIHPDVGGTVEGMQELNATVEILRNMIRSGRDSNA